jgi:large subunit ribosomal protein L10
VLVAQLLGSMQSPLYGLLSVLSGPLRSLAYLLQARADQMEQPADAE